MSKNIYRICLAWLLAAAVIAGALSGCSGGEKVKLDPGNPVTITIWHYYHGAQKSAFDQAVREFNNTEGYEKGVIVEAASYGGVNELADSVMAAARGELDAGTMPDVFGSYGDTALEILNLGLVAAVDDYLSDEELAEYEESFIREGRIGTDKLYVFPIAKSTESLMLNKTDFDAFAEDLRRADYSISYDDLSTWEGIARVADLYYTYTEQFGADNKGKAFFGIDSLANYLIVGSKQLGQDIVSVENGEPSFNLDAGIMSKLWDTYYNGMVTGRFTKLGRFCSDDIKTGDSLCFIGSTASASYFPTELPLDGDDARNIEMIALPMPVFEGGEKVAISQGAGMVIAKSTPEKEYASALFLKWFTDAERNVSFALRASYLPVKKDALNESLLNPVFESVGSGDAGAQNTVKALEVGVAQLREYTMYSSVVFDGGNAFRLNLPKGLEDAAGEDREVYLRLIGEGLEPQEALEELSGGAKKFETWLASLGSLA